MSQELVSLLGELPQGIEVYYGKVNIDQGEHIFRKYNLHPADVEVFSLCRELKPDLALVDDLELRDALREIGIITFCTNQINALEEHRRNDTLFFGECIKLLYSVYIADRCRLKRSG